MKARPLKKNLVLLYAFCFYFNVLAMDNVKGTPRKQLCPLCLLVQSFRPCNSGHNSEKSVSPIDGAVFSLKYVTKKFPSAFSGLIHPFITTAMQFRTRKLS
jgi:hypothetical protein